MASHLGANRATSSQVSCESRERLVGYPRKDVRQQRARPPAKRATANPYCIRPFVIRCLRGIPPGRLHSWSGSVRAARAALRRQVPSKSNQRGIGSANDDRVPGIRPRPPRPCRDQSHPRRWLCWLLRRRASGPNSAALRGNSAGQTAIALWGSTLIVTVMCVRGSRVGAAVGTPDPGWIVLSHLS